MGETFSVTNGKLDLNGTIEGFVGDNSWGNYMIIWQEFHASWGSMQILVRVQDRDNYMLFQCGSGSTGTWHGCGWSKVINGEAQAIPGTGFNVWMKKAPPLRLEVEGNIYRTFLHGDQKVYFVDDTFSNGGFGLRYSGDFQLEGVEVRAMP